MRILFLTNFYPPASRGGYEQWCQEVADGMRSRGHRVQVLASTYGNGRALSADPPWVRRELHMEMEFASLRNALQFFVLRNKRESENLAILRDAVGSFHPDIALVWGMWNLPRSTPACAEKRMRGRVVYYLGDYWVALPGQFENYWNARPRNYATALPKMILRPIARWIMAREKNPDLQLEHTLFPSVFMRDELVRKGISLKNTKVIYGAINTHDFLDRREHTSPSATVSLLYAGRLVHEKGVHTAIEAIAQLLAHGVKDFRLTLVGDGEPDYVNRLTRLVKEKDLSAFVRFIPAQPKESMPGIYRQSDIFVFPSIWAEPFGRVIVEAMASGVAVVGTAVGGAAEIIREEENGLIFAPNDPVGLSRQIKRLIESPALRTRLAEAGYRTAMDKFDIRRMTAEIESYLHSIVSECRVIP